MTDDEKKIEIAKEIEDAIVKARELYHGYIANDQTKSIAIVQLARLIIEENRRGKGK